MRCKSCGKEIDKYEIFCDDCKDKLKNASSREELKELERLIQENKETEDLEMTKELTDIENLEIKTELQEKPEIDVSVLYESTNNLGEPTPETREERNQIQNNKNQKKILIIIIGIIAFFVLVVVSIILLNLKNKDNVDTPEVDYRVVLNDYGKEVEEAIKKFKNTEKVSPTWNDIKDNVQYDKYLVACGIHNIYEDDTVYLANCRINEENTKYTYGTEKIYQKSEKQLTIFANGESYNVTDGDKVGLITCKNEDCTHVIAFDDYEITKENEENYIYNYKTDTLLYGPFILEETLNIDNKLYSLLININNTQKIYSLISNKLLKEVSGTLETGKNGENSVIYKYGYALFASNNRYNFVNLKTGNISYYIEGTSINILSEISNILYFIYTDMNNKFKVINSNGKQLFDESYKTFSMINNNFIFIDNDKFAIYDNNLNLKTSSKQYDKVLQIAENYIAVLNKNHLELLDNEGNLLAKYSDDWKSDYEFDIEASGIIKEKDGDYIYLVVIDKSKPEDTLGYIRKYYYNKTDGKSGLIEENK